MHFHADASWVSEHSGHGLLGLAVRLFSPAAYVAVSVLLLGLALWRPMNNWDMIGYIACAKEGEFKDAASLHAWVFTEVKDLIGDREFNRINHTPFRQAITNDPEALRQQLPFYRVRVLYTAGIRGLMGLGVDAVRAAHLVPALSAVVGLWLLGAALARRVSGPLLGLLPLFALAFGAVRLATDTTPDGLAFLLVAAIVWLVMRESRWLYLIAPVSMLVRADLLMFVLPVLVFEWFRRDGGKPLIVASAVATVAVSMGVCRWSGYYGIKTLLYCNYVEFLAYPENRDIHLGLADALVAWKQGIRKILLGTPFFTFLAVLMASVIALARTTARGHDDLTKWFLLLCSTIYVVVHFVLFPSMMERFFVGQYLMAAMALIWILGESLDRGRTAVPA